MKERLDYLEGMRALMAFNVIICHFICSFYPQMYFYDSGTPLSYFVTTPLSALVNGNIAVVFFFALTGFLVARSVFIKNTDYKLIEKKFYTRYKRLLPIIAIATIFTFITMKLGLQYHLYISNPNANISFLSEYCNFEPSIPNLIANIFLLPFFTHSDYIGPFWTINYELWGYIIVLIAATLLKDSKFRRITYIIIIGVTIPTISVYYSIFAMGLLVADLCYNNAPTVFSNLYKQILSNKIFVFACFIVSSYFACCPMNNTCSIYSIWFKIPYVSHILLRGFGMSLFIFVAVHSDIIKKLLSFKPLVFLGERSFETYALHWPIMLSFEAGVFLLLEKHLSYHGAALTAFVLTIPVIYIASILLNFLIKKTTSILTKR